MKTHGTVPFIVTYIDFNRDPTVPDLKYDKSLFYNQYSGLII